MGRVCAGISAAVLFISFAFAGLSIGYPKWYEISVDSSDMPEPIIYGPWKKCAGDNCQDISFNVLSAEINSAGQCTRTASDLESRWQMMQFLAVASGGALFLSFLLSAIATFFSWGAVMLVSSIVAFLGMLATLAVVLLWWFTTERWAFCDLTYCELYNKEMTAYGLTPPSCTNSYTLSFFFICVAGFMGLVGFVLGLFAVCQLRKGDSSSDESTAAKDASASPTEPLAPTIATRAVNVEDDSASPQAQEMQQKQAAVAESKETHRSAEAPNGEQRPLTPQRRPTPQPRKRDPQDEPAGQPRPVTPQRSPAHRGVSPQRSNQRSISPTTSHPQKQQQEEEEYEYDLPDGEWEYDQESGYYWSDDMGYYYHRQSGQYFDPESGQWYDPEADEWYDPEP